MRRSRQAHAAGGFGRAVSIALVAAAVALGGCRSRLGGDETGLGNFGRVDAGLYRSAQPSHAGLVRARELGVRTVVDLRGGHPDASILPDTGLDDVSIPMHAWRLTDDEVAAFLAVAADPAQRPVLVHCRQGRDRTGALVAAYRIAVEGWPREQAIAEMNGFGAFPFYAQPRRYLRTFDPGRVLALAAGLRAEHAAGATGPAVPARAPSAPAAAR